MEEVQGRAYIGQTLESTGQPLKQRDKSHKETRLSSAVRSLLIPAAMTLETVSAGGSRSVSCEEQKLRTQGCSRRTALSKHNPPVRHSACLAPGLQQGWSWLAVCVSHLPSTAHGEKSGAPGVKSAGPGEEWAQHNRDHSSCSLRTRCILVLAHGRYCVSLIPLFGEDMTVSTTPGEHQPPGNSSQSPSNEIFRLITLSHSLAFADPYDALAEAEEVSFLFFRCQTRTQLQQSPHPLKAGPGVCQSVFPF